MPSTISACTIKIEQLTDGVRLLRLVLFSLEAVFLVIYMRSGFASILPSKRTGRCLLSLAAAMMNYVSWPNTYIRSSDDSSANGNLDRAATVYTLKKHRMYGNIGILPEEASYVRRRQETTTASISKVVAGRKRAIYVEKAQIKAHLRNTIEDFSRVLADNIYNHLTIATMNYYNNIMTVWRILVLSLERAHIYMCTHVLCVFFVFRIKMGRPVLWTFTELAPIHRLQGWI